MLVNHNGLNAIRSEKKQTWHRLKTPLKDTAQPMKRRGYISQHIETEENFILAWAGYSNDKHSRITVRKFESRLMENLSVLLKAYQDESWHTSPYKSEIKQERKTRVISKLPIQDHIIQWAACRHVEPLLCDTFIRRSCSCVKGRGTHDFVNLLRKDMNDVAGTYYYVQLDAHHFFHHIRHDLMKQKVRRKIKDAKLLRFLDEFIDSFHQGLPLGVKISQILANYFLADFDRLVIAMFNISQDRDKMAYWCDRYITDCLVSCRTQEQAAELAKGVAYLKCKFESFVREGIRHYSRFADNIIIQHSDKTFLHIVTELAIMTLARDYYIDVNRDWNVRPVHSGGIDVCGYVSYHDHRRLRKRNKVALCRDVAKWRKRGLSPEEIRQKCASRIGFATHADCRNLLNKLDVNMGKRLGTVIKENRRRRPFEDMTSDQKKPFSELVCKEGVDEEQYKILLIDYKVVDSTIAFEEVIVEETGDDGRIRQEKKTQPKKCLAIRYKKILKTITEIDIDGEETETYECEKKVKKTGIGEAIDAEFYSFSGSAVMINQATCEISKDDLPCPTVIKEFRNKHGMKFYKFT